MRGAVLANAYAVVRKHICYRQLHERAEPERGLYIIAEHEERGAVCPQPAVKGHAVGYAGHGQFTHAKVYVAAFAAIGREVAAGFKFGIVGRAKVRTAAEKVGHMCEYAVEYNSAAGAGGLGRVCRKHFIIAEHSLVHFALAPGLKLRGKLGICFSIACIHFFVFFACARPAQGQRLKVGIYVFGNIKRRVLPAKTLAHVRNNIIAKGRTVRAG